MKIFYSTREKARRAVKATTNAQLVDFKNHPHKNGHRWAIDFGSKNK